MIALKNSEPVFYSIHIRRISKFIIWDIIGGTIVYGGLKSISNSDLLAFGGSFVAVESLNQVLKRTATGRNMIKY